MEAPRVWEAWLLDCARRYLDNPASSMEIVPLPKTEAEPTAEFVEVALPQWMAEFGPNAPTAIPVDRCCLNGDYPEPWMGCDWLRAAYLMLSGAHERAVEQRQGPVHSYRLRLPRSLAVLHQRPWVNWIFLFLARLGADGPIQVPKPLIYLTHDVDAVTKALPTRIKQGAFHLINAGRHTAAGRLQDAGQALGKAVRSSLMPGNYWQFETVMRMEEARGYRSTWTFYGGRGGWRRSPRKIVMDPIYSVQSPALASMLRTLVDGGWHVGLHQAFDSWSDSDAMTAEAATIAAASGAPVTRCRQHWLRFSWRETWAAQQAAGLHLDTTLGFNDAIGFRNGAALEVNPWDPENERALDIRSVPLVLMDSHLHDYNLLNDDEIQAEINRVVDEITLVGGTASVLWHQRVMHPDYGWDRSYAWLLDLLKNRAVNCA